MSQDVRRQALYVESAKMHVDSLEDSVITEGLAIELLKVQRDTTIAQLDIAVRQLSITKDQLEVAKDSLELGEQDLELAIAEVKICHDCTCN